MRKVQTVRRGETITVTVNDQTIIIDASIANGRVRVGVTHTNEVQVSDPLPFVSTELPKQSLTTPVS